MLADAPGFLVDLGATAGAVVAILGAIILVSRLRPVRWAYRRLVSEPFAAWFREQVRHEVEPLHTRLKDVETQLATNGGDTLRDRVDINTKELSVIRAQLGGAPPPGTP